jgi:hypothetical protein
MSATVSKLHRETSIIGIRRITQMIEALLTINNKHRMMAIIGGSNFTIVDFLARYAHI